MERTGTWGGAFEMMLLTDAVHKALGLRLRILVWNLADARPCIRRQWKKAGDPVQVHNAIEQQCKMALEQRAARTNQVGPSSQFAVLLKYVHVPRTLSGA